MLAYYHGWLGNKNLGDEACFQATKEAFSRFNVDVQPWDPSKPKPDFEILGGGTILRACSKSITRKWGDIPLVVFGSGIEPYPEMELSKKIIPCEDFKNTIKNCSLVGLRGPLSLGYAEFACSNFEAKLACIGDPAIRLGNHGKEQSDVVRVAINIGSVRDYLYGTEQDLFMNMIELIHRLELKGYTVTAFNMWPEDNKWSKQLGIRIHDEFANNSDVPGLLNFLKDFDVVVGEKLHSCVLAFAIGVPFVSLAYREKCIDFCCSVNMASSYVKTNDPNFIDQVMLKISNSFWNHTEIIQKMISEKNRLIQIQDKFIFDFLERIK